MLTRRNFLKTMAVGGTGLAAMGLVGCGSSDSSSTSESTESSSAEESSETTEATSDSPTSATEAAQAETTTVKDENADYSSFIIGVGTMSTSLNPNLIDSDYGDLIYTCLAKTDRSTGETIGYMGDVTMPDDKMTLYVELWDNIYDTEGNHITASDVIFCWDTALADGARSVSKYDSWEATGEYSLEFHLKEEPNMDGAQLSVYIYSQAAYEESPDAFATSPVGCSTYKLSSFTSDYELILERNEDFWATDEQRAIVEEHYGAQWDANWDTITWKMISETTQMTVALEMGDLDYTASMASDDLEMVRTGSLSEDYTVYNYVSGITYCFVYNTDEASPLHDVRVREAISYAIDNDYMVQVVWAGEAQTTCEVGASSLADYNEDWNTEDNYYQYDLDKAKELLEEAGYGDGLDLVIFTSSASVQANMSVVLQSLLKQVGITLDITTLDTSIQNTYRASDRSCWDICITQVGSEDYMYNAYDKAYVQGQYAWDGTNGYYVDDTLNEMLKTVTSYDGYNLETLEEFHEYTIDLCLMYGIANAYSNYVVRNGIQVVLSPSGQDTYWQAFYYVA